MKRWWSHTAAEVSDLPLPSALPLDVKLMQLGSQVLLLCLAGLLLWLACLWVLRHPAFALRVITVQGDVARHNAVTLRANIAPRLKGNFFTADLVQTRSAFEAVPWVRKAVVKREFPNRLRVILQEHQAQALWGNESESRLVNSLGEVFEANLGELEPGDLPRLSGPEGQAALVLGMYRELQPVFAALDLMLAELHLSGRGGWRGVLGSGAAIELGAGQPQELVARVRRFAATLTQVADRYGRRANSLESADLRHTDGYALRLRGVTTLTQDTPNPAQRK
ncbi:MAG: cell division protein FtsQ/DivIB [Burkholderiaceae bacterium]